MPGQVQRSPPWVQSWLPQRPRAAALRPPGPRGSEARLPSLAPEGGGGGGGGGGGEEEEEEPPRPRGVRCKEPGLHPTCRGEFQSQAGLAVEKHAASLRSCNALPAGPRKLHKWLKRAGENGPPCKCALLCTKEHRMPTFVAGFGKHTPPS
ncbi:unnamed protein product, partial [Prorocentrum cordatum]